MLSNFATPVVAGSLALVRQYFQDWQFWALFCNRDYALCKKGAFSPSGSLLKAIAIHSGQAISKYSGYNGKSVVLKQTPDMYQGYGRMVLDKVLPLVKADDASFTLFVDDSVSLPTLSERRYNVAVNSSSVSFKVTVIGSTFKL